MILAVRVWLKALVIKERSTKEMSVLLVVILYMLALVSGIDEFYKAV